MAGITDARDEARLLLGWRRGDQESVRRVVTLWGPAMLRVALALCRRLEDAEEVVQDALLLAHRSLGEFDSRRGTPRTWLVGVTVNRARQVLRGKRRYAGLLDRFLQQPYETTSSMPFRGDLAFARECLGALPAREREAFVLVEMEEMSSATSVNGTLPSIAPQVRVDSQRLLKQNLFADVRDLSQFQATFVIIRGYGPQMGARGSGPSNDPSVSGLQSGRPLPGGSERPAGSRDDQHAMALKGETPGGASVARGGTFGAKESRSAYFVRAFVGSRDPLSPAEHGYLGKAIKAITLRSHEAWGTPGQQEGIRALFGLPSLIAIDGAYLPGASGAGVSEGSVIVAAADNVYEIGISGEQTAEASAEHTVTVRFARKFPESKSDARLAGVEIPVIVRNGAVAVLCVPDFLLSNEDRWDSLRRKTLVCAAVSPRFADLGPAPEVEPFPSQERGNDPPVVLESSRPRYPDEARALGVQGEVVIEMTVLRDGGVYGVHVVSLPEQHGAELLIEPASSAVRRWRFLPARVHGEPVDATVRMRLTFGLDSAGEK